MDVFTETKTDSQAQKAKLWRPKGKSERREKDKLGVCDQQIQTTTYKINNKVSPTVQHKVRYSISCNKP